MNIEKSLGQLFDFQKYENNEKLDKVINDSLSKAAMLIPDDDLEYVAAGRGNEMLDKPKNILG